LLVEKLKEKQGDRTQAELASDLGITQIMLSRLYSGQREIGLDTLRKIASRYPDLAFLFLGHRYEASPQ
jgi:transcriptional regulator with XRE-family HTH domain